jgi:hypothetical protein
MENQRSPLLLAVGLWTTAAVAQPPTFPENLPERILWKSDGAEMVLVPAGEFLSGRDRKVATLPAFYIDRYEVSRGQFARFMQEQGHEFAVPPGEEDLAADSVLFGDAQQYAAWAGKRLPTLAEWEKAARGTDGRKYPWNAFIRHRQALDAIGYPRDPALDALEKVCAAAIGQRGTPREDYFVLGLARHLAQNGREAAAIEGWRWLAGGDNPGYVNQARKQLHERGIDPVQEP